MYKWYQKAEVCYVYLADFSLNQQVVNSSLPWDQQVRINKFADSRWFTRGWTLQELLAPEHVVFYDRDWIEIGSRSFLKHVICEATYISPKHMKQPRGASIATKMSWASNRETSREEDMAYSLLGLFDIHMPLIYGEGENAFFRLQSEIIRNSSDESIYAWSDSDLDACGLLARSPRAFYHSSEIVPMEGLNSLPRSPPYMTNRGLAIETLGSQKSRGHVKQYTFWDVPLNCARLAQPEHPFKLRLRSQGQLASRIGVSDLPFYEASVAISHKLDVNVKSETLYVENRNISQSWFRSTRLHRYFGVNLSQAAQDIMLFFKYHTPFEYVLSFI